MGYSQPLMMQTTWRGPSSRDGFSGQQEIHAANLWVSSEGQQVSEDEESRLDNSRQEIVLKDRPHLEATSSLCLRGKEEHREKGVKLHLSCNRKIWLHGHFAEQV